MNDVWCWVCRQRCGSGSTAVNMLVGAYALFVVAIFTLVLVGVVLS